MAVHPAHDGQLAVDGDLAGDGASRGATSSILIIFAAVFAVIIVAALGVVVYGLVSGSDDSVVAASEEQSLRDEVMSQADQFVLRSNSYGPSDLDENNKLPAYTEGVREVITSKFEVSFDESVTLAEQSVAQAGYARDVELYATGVESVDSDTATVLVAGVFTGSYPDSSAKATAEDRVEFEPQPFRFKVTLVQSDGTWLVDDFAPLASEVIDPSAGTDGATTPTERPSATPSREPSKQPSNQPSKPTSEGGRG